MKIILNEKKRLTMYLIIVLGLFLSSSEMPILSKNPDIQDKDFNPGWLGELENDPIIIKANFKQIEPLALERKFSEIIPIIQKIMDTYPRYVKVQIVGYFRLYENLGSSGIMEYSKDKKYDFLIKSKKALDECAKLINSQSDKDKETIYKEMLKKSIPIGYILIYSNLGCLQKESRSKNGKIIVPSNREEYFQKIYDLSLKIMKENPNSSASLFVYNAFDLALINLYSSVYESKIQEFIKEFENTALEERFFNDLAMKKIRDIFESKRELRKVLNEIVKKYGKTKFVEGLLKEERRMSEMLFKEYYTNQNLEYNDENTSPTANKEKTMQIKSSVNFSGSCSCGCGAKSSQNKLSTTSISNKSSANDSKTSDSCKSSVGSKQTGCCCGSVKSKDSIK